MKRTKSSAGRALVIGAALAVSGCVVAPNYPRDHYAPPPHAPAHGYRKQHEGREIRYDASLGVYVVVGFPDLYFLNNVYYRYDYDHWYYSRVLGKGWRYCTSNDLPPGLAKKYKHKKKRKHKK